jgi:hypothetical protein
MQEELCSNPDSALKFSFVTLDLSLKCSALWCSHLWSENYNTYFVMMSGKLFSMGSLITQKRGGHCCHHASAGGSVPDHFCRRTQARLLLIYSDASCLMVLQQIQTPGICQLQINPWIPETLYLESKGFLWQSKGELSFSLRHKECLFTCPCEILREYAYLWQQLWQESTPLSSCLLDFT